LLAFSACGGDEPAANATTAIATDTTAETTAGTTAPETTTPDAALATYTADELGAALPVVTDLGEGWVDFGDAPVLDPAPGEGLGVGSCGGANAVGRAAPFDLVATAQGPNLQGPGERRGATSIYSFETVEGATGFIDTTYQAIECPDGVSWEWIQRTQPAAADEYNGFGIDDFADGETWFFTEYGASEYEPDYPEGDAPLLVSVDRTYSLTAFEIEFGQTAGTLARYVRFGNVVVVTAMSGNWAHQGYVDLDKIVAFEPTAQDLADYTNAVVPLVLERLGID